MNFPHRNQLGIREPKLAAWFIGAIALVLSPSFARAQTIPTGPGARALITDSIDEGKLVPLPSNTRPEAIPGNDRGAVANAFPMAHILLQLRRPPERESMLEQFLDELQDPKSPEFHKWLKADQFGQSFGVAQQDLDTIAQWLQLHGFTVNSIYPNRMVIDFSGTAGQIRDAFHTEIHSLNVNGVEHIANLSDPLIPAALAPAIVGIVSLHDFQPRAQHEMRNPTANFTTGSGTYAVVPADLATIYSLNPLFSAGYSGQGQTIAVIEDTDVFSASDWDTFRSTFGLSSYSSGSFSTLNPAPLNGANNCADPGVLTSNEGEAILDAEWSSAAAPGAAIVLASCADTSSTFGGLIALQNLINGSTPPPAVISISYGECEAEDGATANAAYNSAYQQAVTEGVSVFVSAGDSGAAGCDGGATVTHATHGIGLNALASTPNNVAVGGTDFSDTYSLANSTYWDATNSSNYGSALSYIPEIPWNDSCASALLSNFLTGSETTYGKNGFCNSSQGGSYLTTVAGSGGPSGCATGSPSSTGIVSGSCQGWAKPSWQAALSNFGNPNDGVRDLPDVSLFAANGVSGHYYIFCWSDTENGGADCADDPSGWSKAGGTSFASPIMAGIQALINQETGQSQGNPNSVYYQLAATEYNGSSAACNSSNGTGVASTCIFYDVTQGDIDVNCTGRHNCYLDSAQEGVLSTSNGSYDPAYGAATGWDFATGIGSVNAANLANNWPNPPLITSAASTSFLVGSQGMFTVTATGEPPPSLTESGALPSGVTFNAATGVLGGMPATGTGGVYNITFTATNGVGTAAAQNFTLAVDETPAITSANSTTFAVGSPGTFTVTETGFPAPTLTESGGLPNGIMFNTATGLLGGTPASGTAGIYNISFTASNGVGANAVQSFTLTVTSSTPAAISFVQVNAADPQTPQSTVTLTYTAAQLAGDLNVIVVGWSDSTATISSVADSAGNTYSLAVGPTVQTGTATQSIYFAPNIVATATNSNSVTVTFSAAANFPDIRIAEYSGLDPSNPFDVAVAAQGTSTSSSSGSVTTTNANDLLVGANLVQTVTTAAGTGYTNRVITAPDGDILEDQVVTTTGSYSAAAAISPSGPWIMQMVAFRAAGSGVETSPNITSVSPSSGPVGTSVTITGTNFGSTQGTSTVTFNGTVATPTSWSATSIAAPAPNGATTGNVVVTVSSLASNGVNFTVTAANPSITGLNPSSGPVGTSVTITGTNFGSTQGASTITFNGTAATPTNWSATSIVVAVPTGAGTGNVVVTVGGQASNGVSFTVTTTILSITSLSPSSGPVGTSVTIIGTSFGSTQGASTVTFNGTAATPTNWSATSIVVPVPAGATTGNVVVTVGGQASNGASFTVSVISSGGPTLIQHVSSSNTRGIDLGSPFCYYFQLPNPTTSGNAVIVGVTFGNNPTPTVTDDQGDSYAIVENYYDSTNSQSVAIAAALNVAAGARNISVCLSSDPGGWVQPMATEFNNVVAVDGLGTASQGTGALATAGSLTPAVSGDLTYQVVFSPLNQSVSFTAGSQGNITWNLLSADLMDGWAGQYGVYNSTSAINPTMNMGASQQWWSAAILLQVGTAGSVPSGMRIVHLVHENIPIHEASGGTGSGSFPNPMPLQLPSSGNLLVAMIGGGPSFETVTSLTDTNNNSWIQAGSTFVTPDSVMVQTYFAGNAVSSGNLGLTLNWSGSDGDYTILFYDVTGAATSPLDTTNGATDVQTSTSGTLTVPYTLTPAQPGELIFTDTMWDANTGTGLTSSTGTPYFDTNIFSGESLSGPEPVDENNGWGHVISTSTSPMSFTWSQLSTTLPAGNWASTAVAFLPAGNQNSQPVATPTFSPAAGTYSVAQAVTISDVTAGAQIYYTTDGSIPSTASTLYNGTAIVVSTTTTIQAIAVASGLPNSVVASGTYAIQPTTVHIDVPTSGTTVSGTVGIWGWAVDAYAGGTAISNAQIQVDGVVVGTATYGSSRPDVCSTYAGCPNVGFSFSLDTSSLSAGTHTITAIATDSSASPNTGSSSITVNVQGGPPSVHIDTPASGTTVSGTVGIWGWAVDAYAGGTAISNAQIQVDGVAVGTATYGSSRPDVCSTYAGCPNVGFSFSLNTSSLSAGTHTITAIATDSSASPNTGSSSITVNVQGAPPSVHIDTPASGATVSGTVGIWGWAVDAYAGGTAISNVQIQVDGVAVGTAAYGSSRPDVCSTYAGCPNVGFSFSLDTSSLTPGTHTITAIATDNNANPNIGSFSVSISVSE